MVNAFVRGDNEQARQLHTKWLDVFEGMFIASNPVPVKFALSELGYGSAAVRLPLVPLDEPEKNIVHEIVRKVKS